MKEAILRGEVDDIGKILHDGWMHKKQMADGISNASIDSIYETALQSGATGGKISGAGGGGFMIFYAPYIHKYELIRKLNAFGGTVMNYNLTTEGLTTWTI
jgi:D-glycero-alpha-D-manno-heptose-7-phosphate kinase